MQKKYNYIDFIVVISIFEIFVRLSVDKTIRYYLFKQEYYRTSFQYRIIKADLYHDDADHYYTINPATGTDFIAVKNRLGLWCIDIDRAGGV